MALAGIKEVSHLELQAHPVVHETFVKVEVHIPTVLQIFRIIYLAFRLIVCIGIYPKAISELHRVSPRKNSPRIVERFYSSWGIYLAIISLYLHTPTRAPLSDGDNTYKPLAARTVSMTLKKHADEFGLEDDNHITNSLGKQVNGFWGIEALISPGIL